MTNIFTRKPMLIGLLIVFLAGCNGMDNNTATQTTQPPTPQPTPTVPLPSPTPDLRNLSDIENTWGQSPHAQEGDEVNCDICHRSENGIMTNEVVWLNQNSGQYETVNDYSDLCSNCHEGYDHAESAHKNFTCLECHDHHSAGAACLDCHKQVKEASLQVPATPISDHTTGTDTLCNGSGCHSMATQVAEGPFSIHGAQHTKVTCAACHDAEGLQVGPLQDGTVWVSWSSSWLNNNPAAPFNSHNLQYQVDCKRCHYENNPWGLYSEESSQAGN